MEFKQLQIIKPLLRALAEKGYTEPTPIQAEAIPAALRGCDLLGTAQTGTGKTAAFAIPILQHLAGNPVAGKRRPIRALVLTPTRELAIQIADCFSDYCKYTGLRHTVVVGGVNQRPQTNALKTGVDTLIATPGRLLDLIGQGFVSLDAVECFVLDEADRMLDMGFIHDVKRLLPLLPQKRQTLFFSATMPQEVASLARCMLHEPVRIDVAPEKATVEQIRQSVYFVGKTDKKDLLLDMLRKGKDSEAVLVFSRTKHGADRIARILFHAGIGSEAIHGNKSQSARQRALSNFKEGRTRVMVATDIAARGIDIEELPLVINYDLPEVAETYVHRIGRTGRAGRCGRAFSFCCDEERPLLKSIERLIGRPIPVGA
jgi:ATP-dependent RNA helicase deaD